MKLATVERPIERFNVSSEKKFSVKGTGKAFRILSSGLYKDKIKAIVRELSCNAYDSHIAAGKADVPFKVHLPTSFEPWFSIQDFGTGLTDAAVYEIYTTYFESTKTDSNDFIGALGLGSKSPFSYIDSYTVISIYNGEKRTYSLFIDEDDCPVVTQMGATVITDESNGVTVTIPVETTSDFSEFSRRAEEIYEHFPVTPIVIGIANFKAKHTNYVLSGTRYKIRKTNYSYNSYNSDTHPRAIMGLIAYPINIESIISLEDSKYVDFFDLPIDIYFDLGELEFTAGREDLSYDKKITLPALRKAIEEIGSEMTEIVEKNFLNCKTEYAARNLYGKLSNEGWPLDIIKPVWNGMVIDSADFVFNFSTGNFAETSLTLFKTTHRSNNTRIEEYGNHVAEISSYRKRTSRNPSQFTISTNASFLVVINDLSRGAKARCKALYEEGEYNFLLLFNTDDLNTRQTLQKKFEGCSIMVASEIETAPRIKKAPISVRYFNHYAFSGGISAKNGTYPTEVDMNEGGFYILFKNTTAMNIDDRFNFGKMVEACRNHGFIGVDENIFAIQSSISKKFVENPLWIEFYPEMIRRATEKVTEVLALEHSIVSLEFQNLQNTCKSFNRFLNESQFSRFLPEDHDFNLIQNEYMATRDSLAEVRDLMSAFQINSPNVPFDNRVKQWNMIIDKYPMLKMIISQDRWYSANLEEHIVADYIKMIDSKN